MKRMIVIDPEKCLACRTCELECAIEHSKSKEFKKAINEKPLPEPRINVESYEGIVTPLQCRHCEDAPCVKACPTKALERENTESPVLIKDELCIGCKLCIIACPFGVINMNADSKVAIKCDLCAERLKRGEVPACVEGCPTKAIKFIPTKDVVKKKQKDYLVQFKKELEKK